MSKSQINFLDGDITKQLFKPKTLIIHCCNDKNGFGSGVAGSIARRWSHVKECYHKWWENCVTELMVKYGLDDEEPHELELEESVFCLGEIQLVETAKDSDIYVVNMLGQSTPGGSHFNIAGQKVYQRPFRPESIRQCLYKVAEIATKYNYKVVGPEFCGGLSGANFDTEVVPLIDECLTSFGVDVTIFRFK
jgi:O-acetyl-ADP-ribose deacetylase (regulator of RNase III)